MHDDFAVIEVYYAASLQDTPTSVITEWLLSKDILGLTAAQV